MNNNQQAYHQGRIDATDALWPDLREANERIAELETERDALLEACELALDFLRRTPPAQRPGGTSAQMKRLRTALRKAKGEGDDD